MYDRVKSRIAIKRMYDAKKKKEATPEEQKQSEKKIEQLKKNEETCEKIKGVAENVKVGVENMAKNLEAISMRTKSNERIAKSKLKAEKVKAKAKIKAAEIAAQSRENVAEKNRESREKLQQARIEAGNNKTYFQKFINTFKSDTVKKVLIIVGAALTFISLVITNIDKIRRISAELRKREENAYKYSMPKRPVGRPPLPDYMKKPQPPKNPVGRPRKTPLEVVSK